MYTLLCYFRQLSASILLIVARLLEKVISIVPGVTLIFSHIRRLGPFFGVQNSEFQYFLGFSEKLIFFGGMKILWIFWGVITKLG